MCSTAITAVIISLPLASPAAVLQTRQWTFLQIMWSGFFVFPSVSCKRHTGQPGFTKTHLTLMNGCGFEFMCRYFWTYWGQTFGWFDVLIQNSGLLVLTNVTWVPLLVDKWNRKHCTSSLRWYPQERKFFHHHPLPVSTLLLPDTEPRCLYPNTHPSVLPHGRPTSYHSPLGLRSPSCRLPLPTRWQSGWQGGRLRHFVVVRKLSCLPCLYLLCLVFHLLALLLWTELCPYLYFQTSQLNIN